MRHSDEPRADPVATAAEPAAAGGASWTAAAVAAAATAAAIGLLGAHAEGYRERLPFAWPWRGGSAVETAIALVPGLLLLAIGFVLLEGVRTTRAARAVVLVFAATNLSLQLGVVASSREGLATVRARVESAYTTSYYTDALEIRELPEFLRDFPRRGLWLHSKTHPPGPIVYYWLWIRVAGAERAPVLGGWLLAALAAAVPVAIYGIAGVWTRDPRARATAAAWWAVLPSTVAMTPAFDVVYPALTAGLLVAWQRLLAGSRRAALAFGLLFAVALFCAWNFLALGLYCAVSAALGWTRAAARGALARRLAAQTAIALAAGVALYTAGWAACGYDPWASFERALAAQASLHGQESVASWLGSLAGAPFDLALGLGVATLGLWLVAVRDACRRLRRDEGGSETTVTGAAAILLLLLSARLPQEMSRVWLPFLPLIAVPAALALSRSARPRRATWIALQVAMLVAVVATIEFVGS
jgi:hypothetical protein